MSEEKLSRRQLLARAIAGIAAVPATALAVREAVAAESLAETDPAAKSLAYVGDASKVNPATNPTYKPGQNCGNCIQYLGKAGAAEGGCNIFPDKLVKAGGWCKVWVIKPGASLG